MWSYKCQNEAFWNWFEKKDKPEILRPKRIISVDCNIVFQSLKFLQKIIFLNHDFTHLLQYAAKIFSKLALLNIIF